MKQMFSLIKTTLSLSAALLLAIFLFPSAYFGYRASQPMSLPEFKGLTWVQVTEWRYWEFAHMEMELIAHRPGSVRIMARPVTERTNKCFYMRTTAFAIVPVQAFGYTIAGLKGIQPTPGYPFPTEVSYSNFMNKWWTTAETIEWINAKISHTATPNPECNINHGNMPSADQFDREMERLKMRVAELEALNAQTDQ